MALEPARPAVEADADAIASIYNGYVRDTVVTFTTRVSPAGEVRDAIAQGQAHWVVEHEGRVAGFGRFAQFRPGPGYAHAYEHSVYAAPWAARRGVGARLLAALEEAARAAGGHVLVAGIAGENRQAQAFHGAHGFVDAGRLHAVGWKFGRWHDLVLMQKFLSDAGHRG